MPIKQVQTPYALIDSDPHFARVIRYMRPSDYAVWGAGAAAAPGLLYFMERIDPSRYKHGPRAALRLATWLGACGGFLLAYQRSSFRFMGLSENAPEQAKDKAELSSLVAQGKAPYGETDLTDYLQGVAARNSTWSQLKLGLIPWFNLVNHNRHGVEAARYGKQEDKAE